MDIEDLIGAMVRGSLVSRGKRSHGVGRFLTPGAGSFINASTLLTVGGLVWGAIETMQQQAAPVGAGAAASGVQPSGNPSPGPGLASPPPLPAATAGQAAQAVPEVPDGAARLVRLMVSAAQADGTLADAEKQVILEHARAVGAEALVAAELDRPAPLASIVGGVTDPRQRADLYVLAFAIVRADETITGAERIYLAQLANLLGLDEATVQGLEREAAAHIDRAAQER